MILISECIITALISPAPLIPHFPISEGTAYNSHFTPLIICCLTGKLGEELTDAEFIPYADIPGFPPSSVEGHAARLVFGRLRDREIAVMQGRFHYYEGLTMQEVTFPVYVLHAMGVDTIVLTNACGGINTAFSPGDLMLVEDHVNLPA